MLTFALKTPVDSGDVTFAVIGNLVFGAFASVFAGGATFDSSAGLETCVFEGRSNKSASSFDVNVGLDEF